ncbi:hypothetical protein GCM10029964_035700 [Kibdelosporangium lantanae]
MRIVGDAIARRLPEQLQPVATIEDMQQMIEVVRGIYVAPALQAFIVTITNATRTIPQLKLGASPVPATRSPPPRRPGPRWTGARSSPPTTSSRWPNRCSHTGSC